MGLWSLAGADRPDRATGGISDQLRGQKVPFFGVPHDSSEPFAPAQSAIWPSCWLQQTVTISGPNWPALETWCPLYPIALAPSILRLCTHHLRNRHAYGDLGDSIDAQGSQHRRRAKSTGGSSRALRRLRSAPRRIGRSATFAGPSVLSACRSEAYWGSVPRGRVDPLSTHRKHQDDAGLITALREIRQGLPLPRHFVAQRSGLMGSQAP